MTLRNVLLKRPGMKLMHRFRSNVLDMIKTEDERLIVLLESGKAYVSNKKLTRWRLIKL